MLHPPRSPAARTLRTRFTASLLALALVASACTDDGDPEDTQDDSTTSTDNVETTTTTDPPIILALTPSLGLVVDQCWAEIPEATTTTTTAPSTSIVTFEEPEPTAPETLPETVPTLPKPPTIAVVACEGTNNGQAFAGFCLTEDLESENDRLTGGPCDQPSDLEWPGDRAVRRAAARICLQRFEEFFDESYADSVLVAREFTPTEGVWQQGDRRVVCTVNNPDA